MDRHALGWLTLALALAACGSLLFTQDTGGPQNNFHFSILGDRTGGATADIYEQIWREIDLLHPDFVINVGDTIEGGSDAVIEQQWREVGVIFQRYRHYPLYFTPGNHDVFSETSARLYQRVTGRPLCYSFDYQQAHFIVLDNSRSLELSEEQLQFLQQDLAAHQNNDPKFVFFHKPYWIVPLKFGSGRFRLHELALRYGVDYIISGHGHQLVKMERDGIVYLEVGSSGASIEKGLRLGQGFREGWFFHHVWVSVKGNKAFVTIKEVGPPHGQGRMFSLDDWGDSGLRLAEREPAAVAQSER